jgi:hypothetical protein
MSREGVFIMVKHFTCSARQAEARQIPKVKGRGLKAVLALTVILALAACGDSDEEIYERAYEEGYNDGQYDVCDELKGVSAAIEAKLRNCRGF